MPVRRTSPRFRVEPLEDRVTPAVTADFAGGTLTVTLGSAADTATITGTAAAGTTLEVAGTGFTTDTFTGVTALVVVDSGGNAGQAVTLTDGGAGSGTAFALPGAVTVNGIETVTVSTGDGDLQALSVGIANAAAAINLAAGVTTTGTAGQVYGGPVVVGSATVTEVTLDAGASGGVQFTQSVNGFAADADSLTVNAGSATTPTRFGALVGGSVRLATLTTDAAGTTVFAGNVTTNGAQSYGDPAVVAATQVTFASVSAGVAFLGTLNAQTPGAHGVVVNTPFLTNFAGAVGGVAPLSTLTTDAAGTTQLAANVITTGAQAYGDQVVVSGAAVSAVSTGNGAVTFTGTLSAAAADTTALTVNTGGVTTFGAEVGATRLLSLTTDAAGSTRIGTGAATTAVTTSGAQTFNDAVIVNATTSATFTSTDNGAILFGAGLNGNSPGATAVAVNTGGTTTFNTAVGATASTTLLSLATDAPGTTVLGGPVNTAGAQTYADPVTVTPATGVTSVALTASAGSIAFGGAITGTSAIPFNARASANVTLGGNVTLSGAGSSFTLQAGTSGTGQVVIPAGTTIRADAQAYRAGDGDVQGGLTTATVNLPATLQMRNAAGTGAPVSFVLRQDESVTDATLPNVSQFGGTFPRSIALVSDDGSLTLASTAVAGAQTTDLLLSAAQTLTVGTAVTAPAATVRLRSAAGGVTQTAGGTITAGTLGVRAATGIDLTLAPNAATTVALRSDNGNVSYASATPATVGTVAADVLTAVFPTTAGGQTGNGNVAFTPFGTTALDLTVAAPLAGTAVSATGGAGADRVTVNYSLGATLANGFTFTGGGGTDTLLLTDVGGATAHAYTVGATVVRDSGQPVNLPGVENLSVTGGDAADAFTVTPDADHTITVAGGNPTTGNGDTLTVALAGTTSPVLTSTRTSGGLQGTATFGNRQTLAFGGVETLTPSADVRVTASGPSAIRSGESGTLTVTVTNTGPSAITGQSLVDNFPAGLTATWTAVASAGSSVAATSGTGNINTTADLAVNGTVTFTITLTASGGARGTLTNTFTAGSSASAFELDATNNSATTTITTGPTDIVGVGAGPGGGPVVVAYNTDGTERFRRFAFDTAYSGGVTVATGDLNADGFEDIVAGSAVGASRITAFDGRTGTELATFFAFPGFTGGVNVAVAGGKIVAGAGIGGGPVVAVFTLGSNGVQEVNRFLAFDGNFRGGVQVGGSDRFLAVGAGPGGGPHVKLFDATTLAQTASFFAFPVGSTDGVTVAVGGTSAAPTVIVGSGIGSPPVAATFDAVTLNSLGSFQAFETTFRGGVRVAAGGIVNNRTTTVVAPGGGGSSRVRIVASDNTTVRDFFAFESAFTGGVYVG